MALSIGWLNVMGNANSSGEKTEKTSTTGKMIAKVIKTESWSTKKIVLVTIVLLLPLGPLAVATYFGARELARKKKND